MAEPIEYYFRVYRENKCKGFLEEVRVQSIKATSLEEAAYLSEGLEVPVRFLNKEESSLRGYKFFDKILRPDGTIEFHEPVIDDLGTTLASFKCFVLKDGEIQE